MSLDLNDLRSLVTLASFVTFLGIVAWAYSSRRKGAFDVAARSVLNEDEALEGQQGKGRDQ